MHVARWMFRRSFRPREIPGAIVRSAILGFILGPAIGLLMQWLFGASALALLRRPLPWVGTASGIGAIFSVSFYLTCGMPWVFLRNVVKRMPKHAAWMVGITVSAVGGAGGALLASVGSKVLLGIEVFPKEWLIKALVVESIITMGIGIFMGIYSHMQMEAEIRERKLAEMAARAQAFALQAQIAPHFFFNTLNSISALIPVDPAGAQVMIGRLADVFRYAIASGRDEMVPLEKELEFAREYLAIEKIRYGQRLQFVVDCEEPPADLRLPGLTLQPIVENAIRYGTAKRIEGGTVRIEVKQAGSHCEILVWNQYDPSDGRPDLSEERIFRPLHALRNVRDRLTLAFGPDAGLTLASEGSDWVRAKLTIPTQAANYARIGS